MSCSGCCKCENPKHSHKDYRERCLNCGKHRPPQGRVNFIKEPVSKTNAPVPEPLPVAVREPDGQEALRNIEFLIEANMHHFYPTRGKNEARRQENAGIRLSMILGEILVEAKRAQLPECPPECEGLEPSHAYHCARNTANMLGTPPSSPDTTHADAEDREHDYHSPACWCGEANATADTTQPEVCEWTRTHHIEQHYQADCGYLWYARNLSPVEGYDMHFCPKCGNPLRVVPSQGKDGVEA